MRKRAGMTGLAVLVIALVSCGTGDAVHVAAPTVDTATSGATRLIGPGEFAAAIADPARVTINVHVPFEGDIPGTDLSIPFDQIVQRAGELPTNKNTPLAVYCRSGPMSTTAASALRELGYTDVVELQGGMRSWQQSGRRLDGV